MSSREIAELCKKEHKNVTVVIESLIAEQILTAEIQRLEYNHRGNNYKYYALNKRDSLVVVARLSPKFTAIVIDRWQELEEKEQQRLTQEQPQPKLVLESDKYIEAAKIIPLFNKV